ncbi:hypothetical protein ASD21_17960 [Caulobacter sp. Root1455]|uniref:hypothetical protein n=1 Tax=Caulobacter sp. Root1455 TaxID=1736465 RepID=UPI0006F26648|nr:hypothetical protein [Caulobacter sp. Root1455]KQZ05873.1 hypothetical protein ASD21_17960 [Caulobacter sp. Root1455]
MTDTTVVPRRFEIGRVISGTFSVIGRNFGPFALLALILGGLPNLLVSLAQISFVSQQQTFSPQAVAGTLVGLVVMIVAAFVLQAAIVHATVADLNGRRVVVGESLKVGLRNWLPLLGLAILMGLGLMIGFVLLIVPGIMLAVMWSVAVPAKVVEKIGVMDALQRSRDLTRGRRWAIFGLLVIYVIAVWILEAVIMAAFMPFALSKGLPTPETTAGFTSSINIVSLVASPLIATISTLITTAGGATLYSELRGTREGVGPDALASVFD